MSLMTLPFFLTFDPATTQVTLETIWSAVAGMLTVELLSEIAMVVKPILREPDHLVDTSLISIWQTKQNIS